MSYISQVSTVPVSPTDPGTRICGIFGIISLPLTPYLITITQKTEVGCIDGQNMVWKMSEYELVPYNEHRAASETVKQLNEKYLTLLHKALSAESFYFSFTYDISHTLQRLSDVDQSFKNLTFIERADERFVWNR